MSIDMDRERLSQGKALKEFGRNFQLMEMIPVYLSDDDATHSYRIYCALVPNAQIEQVLSQPSWDLLLGDGLPGSNISHQGKERQVEYLRYGSNDGIEPLIITRDFNQLRVGYREISEEFRHFHRLYHDIKSDKYIKFDEDGNEHEVAVVKSNSIYIRLKEIRQFLAIKEMHLSIQFDYRAYSKHPLTELNLEEGTGDHRKDLMTWSCSYGDFGGFDSLRAFSSLIGLRLLPPLPKAKSGLWGFAEEAQEKYVDFIIGVDENGDDITYTSNPNDLGNRFGANQNAPDYLTAVSFRKQVLDKYYQQPSKYSVEDSIIRCGSLWSIQIDNHHDDKVCVWLGDLGRDLPHSEQLHWRSQNISPQGDVSGTYFKRQLLAQFADTDRIEHIFKQRYNELRKACDESLGWQLLLPLDADDEHHFQAMRIPANNEQRDFDELVLSLTKILIDSLNQECLKKLLPDEQQAACKGKSISFLEAVTADISVQDDTDHISFLRRLQSLRSSSTAHRKGSDYRRVAKQFDLDTQSLQAVFAGILEQAVKFLDYLIAIVRSGKMITTS